MKAVSDETVMQSCKKDSKPNWVICEIATPPKNQIGLFAKLRKSQFHKLRKLRKLRIAICESRENCEYLFEKSNRKKNSPFFGNILTYELITMVYATLSLLSLSEILKIRQSLG